MSKKDNQTKKSTSTKDVEDFLTTTGFILEMKVAEFLIKSGYHVEVNHYFHDYDTEKKREIDIIASKRNNNVMIYLVIECKQSLTDDWIFICSDKHPKRYTRYIKHLPRVKSDEVFNNKHVFDSAIPLAQNYIIKDKSKKKSTSMQIDTCLEKIPKALIDILYKNRDTNTRSLYLPISVFSGQIFTARYNKRLLVKKSDWVQYESNLETEGCKYHRPQLLLYPGITVSNEDKSIRENSLVAKTSAEQGSKYLIDLVTMRGLKQLLSRIEKDFKEMEPDLWPVIENK